MLTFTNATYLDFNNSEIATQQKSAIDEVRSRFGKEYPNIIDGKEVVSEKKTLSTNPANPSEIIGTFQKSGQNDADKAIKSAAKTFESWKNVPAEIRANYLFRAAEEVRKRRLEINAWMISEIGKSYLEADADTCEAIDFLEFYGREAIRYSQPQPLTPFPDELNEYFYIPLGVGLVIPPWNFPFAIMTGITTAAIVTGNTVVLKPSSDTPMMAWLLVDIFRKIGLPDGVLNFLVTSGAEAGDFLVEHPLTRFISFTGGVWTKNPQKIERAKREFHCGNLYINRKCTGAMVDVHPFGGFNMSGTDSKAGSRDYLALFMQGKSVASRA